MRRTAKKQGTEQEPQEEIVAQEPAIDNKACALLATAIRNAATGQHIFTPWDHFELCFRDGQLCRVTPNVSQYERYFTPIGLRVEELSGMSDEAIWKRVMG